MLRLIFVTVQSAQVSPDLFYTSLFPSERTIEDHEYVMEVLSGGGMDTDSRLCFRKNYAKYEFFKKPLVSFEENFTGYNHIPRCKRKN